MRQAHAAQRNPLKPLRVEPATQEDIASWLELAAEVEALFGPMVDDPGFRRALEKNVARGTAWCVRSAAGALRGGLFFTRRVDRWEVGWFAVAARERRRGVGRALLAHCLALAGARLPVTVITFTEDNEDGRPARRFYESFGFRAAEPAPDGPEGRARQVFRLAPRAFDPSVTHR